MPVNPGPEYQKAEEKYHQANTLQERIKALQEMLKTAPKHKSSENLLKEIKTKLSKFKALSEKEKQSKKGKSKYSIKKEGSATLALVGTTNSGKSTLLAKLTNAKPLIADYEFTTTKPEVGTLDYKGIKIQVIEIPALVKNFSETKDGLALLSIIRMADLIMLMFKDEDERKLLEKEIADFGLNKIYYIDDKNIKDLIWKNLNLIKVYTKSPGKEKDFPPVSLKKKSTVRDLAKVVHKDFVKRFRFARIWGSSVKFGGAQVGLDHTLEDDDIIELHLK